MTNPEPAPAPVPVSAEPVPAVPVAEDGDAEERPTEAVAHPAKVMRIGSMIKQLLEEVRRAPLDEAGREVLASIYHASLEELSDGLSEDLQEELRKLAAPFTLRSDTTPSEAERRIAQAQLVGWLEGLFHGIQATLFAQQMQAREQLEELRRRSLPASSEEVRPGTYL